MKKILVFLGLLMIVLLGVGCGGVDAEGISITSENNVRNIKVSETLQLTAKVFPEDADQNVKWSSEKPEVATVNVAGLVTAVSVGEVKIIATASKNDKVQQSFTIIVEEGEEVEVAPESIKISASITTCKAGETITLSALVDPEEANQTVVWESSDTTIATVNRGVVTALKEGKVTITAKAKGHDEISDSIELTFTPSDNPVQTKDWPNMPYSTHAEYMAAEKETPLKVKGVVTYVLPEKEGKVSYLIQNGTDGYYVYNQDAIAFPVELGKVYEVGGLKKYYQGLNEIVDVEYFKALDEKIEYTVNKLEKVDVSSLTAMEPFHCSIVTGKAIFDNAQFKDGKSFSFYATIDGYEATFRVDTNYMSAEEFANITKVLTTAVSGGTFEFTGIMTAFGYGKATPQIQIVKASDIKFAELNTEDLLEAAAGSLTISSTISFAKNEISLPTVIAGFDNLNVTWESNSEVIDVATGTVKHAATDTKVTLTATLTLDGKTFKKSFEVFVFAADNNTYQVVASLDLEDAAEPNSYGNSATKSSYAEGVIELGTPKAKWMLRNALIAATSGDRVDGRMSIRAQVGKTKEETGRIEIQEDGMYNVVEFEVAVYNNDAAGVKVMIEYSTDGGKTWVASDVVISVESAELEAYRIKLPEGNKRVAIVIVENTGRRINIDNIKLMK